MELAVTLRKRPAASPAEPAPCKPRSKALESHRAMAKQAATLVSPHPSTKAYAMTSVTRGEATDVYKEMKLLPVLKVTPKPPPAAAETLTTRMARKAALSRWHPSTNDTDPSSQLTGVIGEAKQLVPAASESRHWRRGESATERGTYRQASEAELLEVIDDILAKKLKWTELKLLTEEDGRSKVSVGMIKPYIYGAGAAEKLARLLETMQFKQMGAPRQVGSHTSRCEFVALRSLKAYPLSLTGAAGPH